MTGIRRPRALPFAPAVLITAAASLSFPSCAGSSSSQRALFAVPGSGPGGVGAARDEWFLSDVFRTSSTWGGDAPCNETAPFPPPHVRVVHLDQNGPMFAAREDEQRGSEPAEKRSRRGGGGSGHGGAAAAAVSDEAGDGEWAACEDDADGLASALGYTRAFGGEGWGGPPMRMPTMPPPLGPAELLTMLKACSGDAKDLLKVLNIVPGDSRASVEQQLLRALSSRARLIVAYFRQRLIEVPEDAPPSPQRAGAGPVPEGHARGGGGAGRKRLVRMDEAMPAFFDELEHRLNMRDGYATVWQPVDTAQQGAPVPHMPVHAVVTLRGNSSADGSACQVRRELTRSPPQLRDGRWSLQPVLVPIEDSPLAPTRRADRALWTAAAEGHVAQVELALRNGARINARMPRIGGWAALHMAASQGHVDAVLCLAARGANVSMASDTGYMPLHLAAAAGHAGVTEALVQVGAPLEALVTVTRDTPLHRAAANGLPYMSALYVCLICLPSVSDAYACLYVCLRCQTRDTTLHRAAANGTNSEMCVCMEDMLKKQSV